MSGRDWTRAEQLQALRLYMRLPFGRLHSTHPEIIAIAERIGRTPGAVSMKACNFASLDDAITSTGRRGLTGASSADRELWSEFIANPEALAAEAESAFEAATGQTDAASTDAHVDAIRPEAGYVGAIAEASEVATEVERLVRARRVQSFFRAAVLTSYECRCAITGLAEPQLLNASHIIPWSENVARRADPTNGVCLNVLFDRAFDRGLITFDEKLRVVVSIRLQSLARESPLSCSILEANGRPLALPLRFTPDRDALDYHRLHVFRAE